MEMPTFVTYGIEIDIKITDPEMHPDYIKKILMNALTKADIEQIKGVEYLDSKIVSIYARLEDQNVKYKDKGKEKENG